MEKSGKKKTYFEFSNFQISLLGLCFFKFHKLARWADVLLPSHISHFGSCFGNFAN